MGGQAGGGDGAPRVFRFDDIVVDGAAQTLARGGAVQPLEPKAFAVLLQLLGRAGEVVTHDELLDAAWGHRHVTPGVVTRAIAQLRAALGDSSHEPRYIQTRHAVGYRFVGELVAEAGPGPGPATAPPDEAGSPAPDDAKPVPVPAAAAAAAAAVPLEPAMTPTPASAPAAARAWQSRSWLVAALVAAAVLVPAMWTSPTPERRAPLAASVAILPFANLGGDRDQDYFAEGLAVEMHDALAGVQGLKVAAPLSPAMPGLRETDPRELGERLGVAALLDASVRRDGQRVRINARLTDCATGYTLWSRGYDRELGDVFATQADIAGEVVRSLAGAIPGARESVARRLAPTRNLAAFDAYLRGLQQLRLSSTSATADAAVGFFREALAADDGFARAQAGICRTELVRFANLRSAGAYANAATACALARDMQPGSSEVELALADLDRLHGDHDRAGKRYARALRDPARAPAALVGLAQLDAAQGRNARALERFARALELSPGNAAILSRLAYQQYLAGDLPAAAGSYGRAAALRPDDASLWSSLGGVLLSMGRPAEAAEALERSLRIEPTPQVLNNYAELRFMAGDYPAAATLLRRALELDASDPLLWGNLGSALLADPATAGEARQPFARAAAAMAGYLAVNDGDAIAAAAYGWYLVNLGQAERARGQVARSEALQPGLGEVAMLNAQTLVALGDRGPAQARIAAARRGGISAARIDSNPFLGRRRGE